MGPEARDIGIASVFAFLGEEGPNGSRGHVRWRLNQNRGEGGDMPETTDVVQTICGFFATSLTGNETNEIA